MSHGYVWKLYDSYDIFLANLEGSILKRLTDSPKYDAEATVSPKGDRIVFTSNVQSENRRNFDLYIINVDGTGLERITQNDTFDGFPMFTRDAKNVVFCSNRFNKKQGETNVFIAEWID